MKQLKLFLLIVFCVLSGASAFAQHENLYIIGGPFSATGDNWIFRDIVQLEKDSENPYVFYYRGYIGYNTAGAEPGNFKILTNSNSWEGGYHPAGSENQLIGETQVGMTLSIRNGGDDTKWSIPSDNSGDGYYVIKIDTENNTFLIESFTPAETTVPVGLFLVGGPFIIDELGWTPSESVKMERDDTNPDVFHFRSYMERNQWGNDPGYFKILINARQWGNEFHPEGSDDVAFTDLEMNTTSTLVKTDDKKWYLPKDGSGNGYWDFTVNAKDMTLTVNEFIHDFDYFNEVYIAGDAMPNGWTTDNPAVMNKVVRGVYSWTGTLKAGDFKFLRQKNYFSGCYVATTENEPVVWGDNNIIYEKNYAKHNSGNDYKFIVAEEDAGEKATITLDLNRMVMTVVKVDSEAPVNFTAAEGTITHNSVELKLKADDNSGSVIFDITYGSESKVANAQSGVETSYVVTDLESGTEYTFSITVKDESGNIGETETVVVTTETPLAVPTIAAPVPTVAANKVKSLFSDTYTAFATYQYSSQTTTYSDITIEGNTTLKLEDFNSLIFEINGNTPLDYSDMTTLHIDIWTPNETVIKISPVSSGTENLVECSPLVQEQWNSYDIDLTEFTNVDAEAIYQLKMTDGTGGVLYIDNIYFYAKENNPNSTISANNENVKWYVQSGILQIQNVENTPVKVTDITGKIVFNQTISASQTDIALSQGIYLLSVADAVFKVIIR